MVAIRIYSGVRSPYSRMGMHILKRSGLEVTVYPFIRLAEGMEFSDPAANPLKLAYYMEDAPRMARRLGLRMRMPAIFDVDFTPANKAQMAASQDGFGIDFSCVIADARWGHGKDVSDIDVLKACADEIGWSSQAVVQSQTDQKTQKALDDAITLSAQDGVFGVPFGVIDDEGKLTKYWGQDRFDLLVEDAREMIA